MMILSLIVTFIACGVSMYAIHISSQVAGDNLLAIDSALGYQYATTYRIWQMAAVISVLLAILLWCVTIAVKVRKRKKARAQSVEQKKEKTEIDRNHAVRCKKCGNQLEKGALFCDICGEKTTSRKGGHI